jgi:ComF family protein
LSNACADPFDYATRCGARRVLREALSRTLEVVRRALPQHCELCAARTGGTLLCGACDADLPRIATSCPVCALPAQGGAICGACLHDPPPYAATVAALVYAFPVDRLIQRIKYGGSIALAHWAGATLAAAVQSRLERSADGDRPRQIVALPLSPSRQRERGFNQAGEIAACVSAATGLPVAAPLARVPGGVPQAMLPWIARRKNVRGAFSADGDVRGARIALVDDVMTTGATFAEASRTLIDAGAHRVECWAVARTLRPEPA